MTLGRDLFSNTRVMGMEISAALLSPFAMTHGWASTAEFLSMTLEGNCYALMTGVFITADQGIPTGTVLSSRSEKHLSCLDTALVSRIPKAEE